MGRSETAETPLTIDRKLLRAVLQKKLCAVEDLGMACADGTLSEYCTDHHFFLHPLFFWRCLFKTVKGRSPLQINSYSFLWAPVPAIGISVALMVLHENKRRYKCQRNVGTD
jgi:hypothetical protein